LNCKQFSSSQVVANKSKEDDPKQTTGAPQKPDENTIEINTKGGKLLVRTTVSDAKLQDVIIEKVKTESLIQQAKAEIKDVGKESLDSLSPEEKKKRLEAELKEQLAEKNKELAKKRVRVDFSRSSLERNFITPVRAMSDFLLKPSDLESLPKTKRRSPYEQEPPITVYWRKDVEARAIDVWGSRENLLKECLKREIEKKRHQQSKLAFIVDKLIN
jgi:zinc transporter 9